MVFLRTIIALLIRFRVLTCLLALPLLSLISPSLISLLSFEVTIIPFFCLKFITLIVIVVPLVGTLIERIGLCFPWPRKFLHLSRPLY